MTPRSDTGQRLRPGDLSDEARPRVAALRRIVNDPRSCEVTYGAGRSEP